MVWCKVQHYIGWCVKWSLNIAHARSAIPIKLLFSNTALGKRNGKVAWIDHAASSDKIKDGTPNMVPVLVDCISYLKSKCNSLHVWFSMYYLYYICTKIQLELVQWCRWCVLKTYIISMGINVCIYLVVCCKLIHNSSVI